MPWWGYIILVISGLYIVYLVVRKKIASQFICCVGKCNEPALWVVNFKDNGKYLVCNAHKYKFEGLNGKQE